MKRNRQRRRWFDRKHRTDIGILAPPAAAVFIGICLATGCPITQWTTLGVFGIFGAVTAIPVAYFLPSPEFD